MPNAESRGGFLEHFRTRKAAALALVAGLALTACGSSTEPAGNTINNPSIKTESVGPAAEAPKINYPDTSKNLTRFTSVAEVESVLTNNTIANDNYLTLVPLLNAVNGNYDDLKSANVDTSEVIANYDINQHFLELTKALREALLSETNTSGESNPDSINGTIETIEASQYLLAQLINNLKNSDIILESSNECPSNDAEDKTLLSNGVYTSKTQAPLGIFGLTKESNGCAVPKDISDTTSNAMQFVFSYGKESSINDNRPVSAELFEIMNSVYTAKDPKVQRIVKKYLA